MFNQPSRDGLHTIVWLTYAKDITVQVWMFNQPSGDGLHTIVWLIYAKDITVQVNIFYDFLVILERKLQNY